MTIYNLLVCDESETNQRFGLFGAGGQLLAARVVPIDVPAGGGGSPSQGLRKVNVSDGVGGWLNTNLQMPDGQTLESLDPLFTLIGNQFIELNAPIAVNVNPGLSFRVINAQLDEHSGQGPGSLFTAFAFEQYGFAGVGTPASVFALSQFSVVNCSGVGPASSHNVTGFGLINQSQVGPGSLAQWAGVDVLSWQHYTGVEFLRFNAVTAASWGGNRVLKSDGTQNVYVDPGLLAFDTAPRTPDAQTPLSGFVLLHRFVCPKNMTVAQLGALVATPGVDAWRLGVYNSALTALLGATAVVSPTVGGYQRWPVQAAFQLLGGTEYWIAITGGGTAQVGYVSTPLGSAVPAVLNTINSGGVLPVPATGGAGTFEAPCLCVVGVAAT